MWTSDMLEKIRRLREQWEQTALGPVMARWPEQKETFATSSGIPLERVYTPADLQGKDYVEDISLPGWYPYTRGVQPTGYRGRLWTRRLVTGFATPEETNRRLKFLLREGETGLNIVFDNPTQAGLDSDNPLSEGEVGRDGVPVDTLRDVEVIFDEIDIARISTSIITAGPFMLSAFLALAQKRGIPLQDLTGTLQNDMVSLFYTANPAGSLPFLFRISSDIIEYCRRSMPRWNPISFVGYQIRESGSTAAQEIAFTFGSAIAYTRELMRRGLEVDDFAPRLSFFFDAHNDFFEEICKYRAARRLWARIMKEEFGARNPLSMLCRYHVQTAGCSLTAREPINNVVRTTLQALAAVLGGTHSLHTNSMDEAYALPSEDAVRTALRTQQIIAYESGVCHTVDPLGGSYFVEKLTDELEEAARDLLRRIDAMGGMIAAVEAGWVQREIARASYDYQQKIKSGEVKVIGMNLFTEGRDSQLEILRIDPAHEEHQKRMLAAVKAGRDGRAVQRALDHLKRSVEQGENVMPGTIEAVRAYATIEEVTRALQEADGTCGEPVAHHFAY
ncbi:MAG: methylmalonyl-CoA mutase family protein [bacterium]